MNSDWRKKNWPHGSKGRFLEKDGSSSVMEALKKRIKESSKNERPAADSDFSESFMNDLARAFAWRVIVDSERKGYRKRNSRVSGSQGHSSIQDQNNREL